MAWRTAGGVVSAAVQHPKDSVLRSVGRYRRGWRRKREDLPALRRGRARETAAVAGIERIGLDGVVRPRPIHVAVPVSRRPPDAGTRRLDLLDDLRIVGGAGRNLIDAILAEVAGIEQVDRAFLALLSKQLLTGRQWRQKQQAASRDVDVVCIQ